MQQQPVVTRKTFDRLSQEQQQRTFTVTGLKNRTAIVELHTAVQRTLSLPNEAEAWNQYKVEARAVLKKYGMTMSKAYEILPISFRMARQQAYIQAILEYGTRHRRKLHGLQYRTQQDAAVRHNHEQMEGVIRPVTDSIWQVWRIPNGFNCRCWLQPITRKQYKRNPEKYAYTKDLPKVKPDKGFE